MNILLIDINKPNIRNNSHPNAVKDINNTEARINKTTMAQRPPPKNSARNERMSKRRRETSLMQQPKPKFVAHKDPTKGKKDKAKKTSNRLGNHLHMV